MSITFAAKIVSKLEAIKLYQLRNAVFDCVQHESQKARHKMLKEGYKFRPLEGLLERDLNINLQIKADVMSLADNKFSEFDYIYENYDIERIYEMLALKLAINYHERPDK